MADYELGIRGFAAWQRRWPGERGEPLRSAVELDQAIDERRTVLADWL